MKKKVLILGVCMLVLTGCGEKTIPKLKDGSEAVATYNDGKDMISVNELYEEMKNTYAMQALVNMIDDRILRIEYKDNIEEAEDSADETIKQFVNAYGSEEEVLKLIQQNSPYNTIDEYKDALVLSYLEQKAETDYAKDKITEKEIKKYYDDEIVGDVKISHILFTIDAASDATTDEKDEAKTKAKEEAEKALNELKSLKGEELTKKFAELAKELSDDESTKDNGGSLGFINKDTQDESYKNLEVAAYEIKDGELYGEVIETSIGYHVLLRTESKEKAKLEDVRDSILEELAADYQDEHPEVQVKALQEMRKKYDMDIIDDEIQKIYANYIQNALLQLQSSSN